MERIEAGRLSHAYMISAGSMSGAMSMAREIAGAAICTGYGKRPCGICRSCRKLQDNIHPDVITLRRLQDDKGKKKREISVDQVRAMAADAYVMPNEAERKVYIIEDAETMNVPAQNAALKLLEEPPLGAIFLLCCENAGKLLPTVRSRCVELSCNGDEAEQDKEMLELAAGFFKAVSSGDRARLFAWCSKNEGLDGRQCAAFMDCAMAELGEMLCGRKKDLGMDYEQMVGLYELLERCNGYLRFNVGTKHIFGLLAVDSIIGGGNRGKAN